MNKAIVALIITIWIVFNLITLNKAVNNYGEWWQLSKYDKFCRAYHMILASLIIFACIYVVVYASIGGV